MAKYRFYIPESDWNLEALALTGDEAHHCRDVMRCQVGERIIAFNGAGTESESEIMSSEKNRVELKPILTSQSPRPPAILTIGQAIPKGKNMDLIIQKSTELGASKIVPLLSARTVVHLGKDDLAKKQEKWQRIALEACKQCGQNWLPEVAAPVSVENFLSSVSDPFRLVAAISDQAESLKKILADHEGDRPTSATMMIGPEGDFTPAEISQSFSAGFLPLSLGPIVLRSETAAIYALSVVGYELMG